MALFLLGGAVMLGAALALALALRPTLEHNQLWGGLTGLNSGILSAMTCLQVTAQGRAGEPEPRIVFCFSIGGVAARALVTGVTGSVHAHSLHSAGLLIATCALTTVVRLMITRGDDIGRTVANAGLQYLGTVYSFFDGVWRSTTRSARWRWPAWH